MKTIKTYLHQRWLKNNHPKYYQYFEEWFANITENQKFYFYKEYSNYIKYPERF